MTWIIILLIILIIVIIVIASFALPEFGEFALNLGKGFLKWASILFIIIVVAVIFFVSHEKKQREERERAELKQEQLRQEKIKQEEQDRIERENLEALKKQEALEKAYEKCEANCYSDKKNDFLFELSMCLDICQRSYSTTSDTKSNNILGLDLKKDDIRLYKLKASYFCKKNQHQQALENLNQIVRLNPNDYRIYMDRGISYTYLKQYNKARKDFDNAIRLKPNNNYIYYNYACMYALQNNATQACKYLQIAIEKGFHDWNYLKRDQDFDKIRNEACFIDILNK